MLPVWRLSAAAVDTSKVGDGRRVSKLQEITELLTYYVTALAVFLDSRASLLNSAAVVGSFEPRNRDQNRDRTKAT